MNLNKTKTFVDQFGDTLIVDDQIPETMLFLGTHAEGESPDDATPVALEPDQVIALRKTLTQWLRTHGHVAPKRSKRHVVVNFDPAIGESRVIAVTIEDDEDNIVETVWER